MSYPYKEFEGQNSFLAMLKVAGSGTTSFGVVLTQRFNVLDILRGAHPHFPPFSYFHLPVINDQSQRPYIRRRCTPIQCLCDPYLGTPYPSY